MECARDGTFARNSSGETHWSSSGSRSSSFMSSCRSLYYRRGLFLFWVGSTFTLVCHHRIAFFSWFPVSFKSVAVCVKKTREIIGACETNAHRTALALVRALSVLFKHVSYKYRKVFCGTPVGKARGRLKFLFFLLSSGLLGVLIHKKKYFKAYFSLPTLVSRLRTLV